MANIVKLGEIAKKGFITDNYELEKPLAAGMGGGVVRFIEKSNPTGGPPRRYIAKIWFGGIVPRKRELDAISSLSWSEHIIDAPKLPDDPWKDDRFFTMEFISGGTLEDFRKMNTSVPNPVLWHIFFCLVRMIVAMAYPNPPLVYKQAEEQVLPYETPDNLAHRDIHPGNLLFGEFDPKDPEHRLVPILKLIDFERSERLTRPEKFESLDERDYDRAMELAEKRTRGKRNPGVDHNILSIGRVMANMFSENPRRFLTVEECRILLEDDDLYPDFELLTLVRRCLAVNPRNRPRLEELMPAVADNIMNLKVKTFMDNYLQRVKQRQGL